MNILKLNVLLVLFFVVFLFGCSNDHLTDGDKHITKEMHEFISDYMVQKNANSFTKTEKQYEVHKIYGTSEEEGVISVYMKSFCCDGLD